jgi:hypothetical protein
MSRIIEIEQGTRCHACDLSVIVGQGFFCAVDGEGRAFSSNCSQGKDDIEFIRNHYMYKELLARCEELEQELEAQG